MGIYKKYYGLNADPFHITPDPSVLLLTESHRKAIGAIGYGVMDRKGFIVVTGEVGVGKTTALRACLDELPADKTKIIYIFDPKISSDMLYATIIESLDIPASSISDRPVDLINRALLECYRNDVNVILAVDEAQHMPAETLESLRLLSNLETTSQKLLQIILVGQPELDQVLAAYSMRQLDQRIAVRARMVPLTFSQSIRYIRHRLALSGWSGQDDLFSLPAASYIAWHAHGVPRKLNIHCDNALANGYGMSAKRITLRIARLALEDMPKRRMKARWAAAGVAGLVLVACGSAFAIAPVASRSWWTDVTATLEAKIAKIKTRVNGGEVPIAAASVSPSRAVPAAIPVPPPVPAPTREASAPAVEHLPPDLGTAGQPPAAPAAAIADPASVKDVIASAPAVSATRTDAVPQAANAPQSVPLPQPDPVASASSTTGSTFAAPPVENAIPSPIGAPEKPVAPPSRAHGARTVVAQTGDTLIRVCAAAYGHCTRDLLLSLAKANQIAEPDVLISGKVLAIPPLRDAAHGAGQQGESH